MRLLSLFFLFFIITSINTICIAGNLIPVLSFHLNIDSLETLLTDTINDFKPLQIDSLSIIFADSLLEIEPELVLKEQLKLPIINVDSILFVKDCKVKIKHETEGVEIHYTVDGSEVTEMSPLQTYNLIVSTDANLKYRAFHPDYLPSETVLLQVRKIISTDKIELEHEKSSKPTHPFDKIGLYGIDDCLKGDKEGLAKTKWFDFQIEETSNYSENRERESKKTKISNEIKNELQAISDKRTQQIIKQNWLGYQDKEVVFYYCVNEPFNCHDLTMSLLIDHEAGILKPSRIEIEVDGEIVGYLRYDLDDAFTPSYYVFWTIIISVEIKESLQIKLVNHNEFPSWYKGKQTKPWIFIDEIIIN